MATTTRRAAHELEHRDLDATSLSHARLTLPERDERLRGESFGARVLSHRREPFPVGGAARLVEDHSLPALPRPQELLTRRLPSTVCTFSMPSLAACPSLQTLSLILQDCSAVPPLCCVESGSVQVWRGQPRRGEPWRAPGSTFMVGGEVGQRFVVCLPLGLLQHHSVGRSQGNFAREGSKVGLVRGGGCAKQGGAKSGEGRCGESSV